MKLQQISSHLKSRKAFLKGFFLSFLGSFFFVNLGFSQSDTSLTAFSLKTMSLDELMEVEVSSISNNPSKISEVPSAIQVITNEEINRSGAVRLPEAVALATNLQSSRVNSHDFGITARGFNGLPSAGGILANKLLVLNDGRSLYTPILGGVYWDVQNAVLEDIDRIEVVSGPGGTIWGANAVNGVINIVSKSAKETQGLFASSSIGTLLDRKANLRYGFKVKDTYVRVYGQFMGINETFAQTPAGLEKGDDRYEMYQTGFRADNSLSDSEELTYQGDFYTGTQHRDSASASNTKGGNFLARYTKTYENGSDLRVQAYYDYVDRETPFNPGDIVEYTLNTYELDLKYRFKLGERNNLMVGGLYQLREDETAITEETVYVPTSRSMPLYSFFFQDELIIVPSKFKMTFGSKFLHNVFTGFEFQPSVRLAYNVTPSSMVWAAVSRAVRLPSRLDADITINPIAFQAENLLAYEIGTRVQFSNKISFSIAGFFNKYDDLRSLDINPDASSVFRTLVLNNQRAESHGVEILSNVSITRNWRMRLGWSYFENNIWQTSPLVLLLSEPFETVDPKHTIRLQSITNLPKDWFLDVLGRYNSKLPASEFNPEVKDYVGLDIRVAKQIDNLNLSLVGQNLLQPREVQAGQAIPRSVYLRFVYSL